MSTPMATESWKLFAWRKGSSIYLKAGSGDRVSDVATEVERTRESFLRMAFHRLLTQTHPSCQANEADKFLKVSRIQLGHHSLISLSEVSARDVDGEEVRVFLKKNITKKEHKVSFYNGQYFNLWAEAQITNQGHIIIGKYNDSDMTVQSIAAVPATTVHMTAMMRDEMTQLGISASLWDPDHACNFLHRFLTFVRKTLSDEDLLTHGRLVSFEYVKKTTKAIIPILVTTMTPFETE